VRTELEEDIQKIEREISEIDMLMEQVTVEIERHKSRTTKLASELESLEQQSAPDRGELSEARSNLLSSTRREMLFDAQRQILEGKRRVLARFMQRLVEMDKSLAAIDVGAPEQLAAQVGAGGTAVAGAAGGGNAPEVSVPALQMRSQEDLRRDIVRQLHDGPAQSIANIGLQAEIVARLVSRRDERADAEIEALHRVVQEALETTKEFIFEIRPMVLDDLGLGPTIRRACTDRSRRSEIAIQFESQGIERRLPSDLESALFRSIDEAMAGFVTLRPSSVLVRLDWSERELLAIVEGTWPRQQSEEEATGDPEETSTSRAGETPPFLLAMMEEKRSADADALAAARSLPQERVDAIAKRALALGLTLTVRNGGRTMELAAPIPR
jgi:two-component system sensor histidine kinase DegS